MKLSGSRRRLLLLLAVLGPAGCAPLPQFPFAANADLAPPSIISMGFANSTELSIGFSEPCELVADSLIGSATLTGVDLSVSYSGAPTPQTSGTPQQEGQSAVGLMNSGSASLKRRIRVLNTPWRRRWPMAQAIIFVLWQRSTG